MLAFVYLCMMATPRLMSVNYRIMYWYLQDIYL